LPFFFSPEHRGPDHGLPPQGNPRGVRGVLICLLPADPPYETGGTRLLFSMIVHDVFPFAKPLASVEMTSAPFFPQLDSSLSLNAHPEGLSFLQHRSKFAQLFFSCRAITSFHQARTPRHFPVRIDGIRSFNASWTPQDWTFFSFFFHQDLFRSFPSNHLPLGRPDVSFFRSFGLRAHTLIASPATVSLLSPKELAHFFEFDRVLVRC